MSQTQITVQQGKNDVAWFQPGECNGPCVAFFGAGVMLFLDREVCRTLLPAIRECLAHGRTPGPTVEPAFSELAHVMVPEASLDEAGRELQAKLEAKE